MHHNLFRSLEHGYGALQRGKRVGIYRPVPVIITNIVTYACRIYGTQGCTNRCDWAPLETLLLGAANQFVFSASTSSISRTCLLAATENTASRYTYTLPSAAPCCTFVTKRVVKFKLQLQVLSKVLSDALHPHQRSHSMPACLALSAA